jgi:hypothetical protein
MDVSDLRRRILHALDQARKEAEARRVVRDEAAEAWRRFLSSLAVPLVRQAAGVLRAEGYSFTAATPADGVRLTSDNAPETFIEFELDRTGAHPTVIGRVSVARGRKGHVLVERVLASGKPVAQLEEADVSEFLVEEIPKLVMKP